MLKFYSRECWQIASECSRRYGRNLSRKMVGLMWKSGRRFDWYSYPYQRQYFHSISEREAANTIGSHSILHVTIGHDRKMGITNPLRNGENCLSMCSGLSSRSIHITSNMIGLLFQGHYTRKVNLFFLYTYSLLCYQLSSFCNNVYSGIQWKLIQESQKR